MLKQALGLLALLLVADSVNGETKPDGGETKPDGGETKPDGGEGTTALASMTAGGGGANEDGGGARAVGGSNMVEITVGGGSSVVPSPYFVPVLNLFSFTNCSNDGLGIYGDRLYYIGNAYVACDGPASYTYDKGPPAQTVLVYLRTTASLLYGSVYVATFYMFSDSACTMPYNFMGPGPSGYQITQVENSCQIYTRDLYNPTAVVSASVFVGAAPAATTFLPLAAIILIATINTLLQQKH